MVCGNVSLAIPKCVIPTLDAIRSHHLIGELSQYLRGSIHPTGAGILSIHSTTLPRKIPLAYHGKRAGEAKGTQNAYEQTSEATPVVWSSFRNGQRKAPGRCRCQYLPVHPILDTSRLPIPQEGRPSKRPSHVSKLTGPTNRL